MPLLLYSSFLLLVAMASTWPPPSSFLLLVVMPLLHHAKDNTMQLPPARTCGCASPIGSPGAPPHPLGPAVDHPLRFSGAGGPGEKLRAGGDAPGEAGDTAGPGDTGEPAGGEGEGRPGNSKWQSVAVSQSKRVKNM